MIINLLSSISFLGRFDLLLQQLYFSLVSTKYIPIQSGMSEKYSEKDRHDLLTAALRRLVWCSSSANSQQKQENNPVFSCFPFWTRVLIILPYSFAAYCVMKKQKTASPEGDTVIFAAMDHTARSTLLERRHLVQAYTWHGVPLTTALTRLTLGLTARLERLWEWETLIPKVTPLPQ